jgi:nicotinate-nucleotide pyrophosphorylase (carboxylating)
MELTAVDVRAWLAEDVGAGDVTSEAVVPSGTKCSARMVLKEPGVICGLGVVEAVFRELDAAVEFDAHAVDGDVLEGGEVAAVAGDARGILAGERLALNVLGRLSGIATLTRRFVDEVAGTDAVILDTRKTTPGLRALEKEAVRCGGGTNHRLGLHDAVLIKDNHLRLAGGITAALARAEAHSALPVEVECESLEQVREAVAAGPDRILLDNMTTVELARAVALVDGRAELEASGGITLENVRRVAETGVDFISIGALTHSARALDVSLEMLT